MLLKNDSSEINEKLNSASPDPSFINTTFQTLNNRHQIIYEFVMRYDDYIYDTHDYGTGVPLTMIESHTLTYIDDHPGTTVTELTHFWHKTKGAISQIVTRLEQNGLVSKQKKQTMPSWSGSIPRKPGPVPAMPTKCTISSISPRLWEKSEKNAHRKRSILSSGSCRSTME